MLKFLLGLYAYTSLQQHWQAVFLFIGVALLPVQFWATFKNYPELAEWRAVGYIFFHAFLIQLVLWAGLYLATT